MLTALKDSMNTRFFKYLNNSNIIREKIFDLRNKEKPFPDNKNEASKRFEKKLQALIRDTRHNKYLHTYYCYRYQ